MIVSVGATVAIGCGRGIPRFRPDHGWRRAYASASVSCEQLRGACRKAVPRSTRITNITDRADQEITAALTPSMRSARD